MSEAAAAGRFTTGSTMRHVAVMTLTGTLGLSFMFLVDFATLFYVSMLGDEVLTAAVGFAWGVQFFTISVGIGFAIAGTALVSRAIGARDRDTARRIATAAAMITTLTLLVVAIVVLMFRREILDLIDADGRAGEVAARFLLISVPSLPFVGLTMMTSSVLRAEGDARRAMMVTMLGGVAAMILDPLFIFALDLGVDGAAVAMVLSRMCAAAVGFYYCTRSYDLLARPSLTDIRDHASSFFRIAGPSTATQLSTPLGNLILTGAIAQYGDSAVAGWAVVSRLTVLAFGGIFSLSGAIGGILGQNYGAKLADRVAETYRNALIFGAGYVLTTWILLALAAPFVVEGFGVSGEGAAVIYAFCYWGAGGWVFAALLFVANAACNNLGRPLWSTGFNWTRDALAIPLLLLVVGSSLGADGVVAAQAGANILLGAVATVFAWRLAHGIRFDEPQADWKSVQTAPASARAAAAMMHAEDRAE